MLEQQGYSAMLVLGHENIRYLSGFSGNAAYALITQNACVLITDYDTTNVQLQKQQDLKLFAETETTKLLVIVLTDTLAQTAMSHLMQVMSQ